MNISDYVKINKITGAIFDMDGTLTSSMSRWREIYAVLADILNIQLPQEFLMKYNHFSMKNCAELIIKDFNLDVNSQSVYKKWLKSAVEYYENIFTVKSYMLETINSLKEIGIKMCVATASDRACAEAFIRSNGLDGAMSSVTSLDEVSRPKSFPDIYLLAARKLGLKPSECLVFEDALTALKSAKSGGFKTCAVQDECSQADEEIILSVCDISLGF